MARMIFTVSHAGSFIRGHVREGLTETTAL